MRQGIHTTSLSFLSIKAHRSSLRTRPIRLISAAIMIGGLLIALLGVQALVSNLTSSLDVLVGLDIAYGGEETALEQIDKVSGYVNLIILGSLELTNDTEKLTRVCDHIYQKGLHFIVYVAFGQGREDAPPRGPNAQFFTKAIGKYGEKFLGVYLFDEVGGALIDGGHSINVTDATTYTEAAVLYTHHLNFFLGNLSQYYSPAKFPLYTSDYALYWYDYVAGYDVVFAEYVENAENQSRQIATGLCRGAAKTLNKDWGVVITWSGRPEYFFQNPDRLYNDMVLAYQNGAKYIVVFNSPGNFTLPTPYGSLSDKHFDKMKQFWSYAHLEPEVGLYPANTAYVLPRDYGYGFRGPDDRIWGKWHADDLAAKIWGDVQNLLGTYVLCLDIVYETKIADKPVDLPYNRLVFWNGTTVQK